MVRSAAASASISAPTALDACGAMVTRPQRVVDSAVISRRPVQARTRRLLLDAAGALLGSGAIPSVAEVALRSGVSRATAYRYFPTRSKLISAIVADSL